MKLHREGIIPITTAFVLFALILSVVFHFALASWLNWLITLVLLVPVFMTIRFFRVPRRHVNRIDGGVISPADGTVVAVEQVNEPEYFKDDRIKISVFMSVYNVHVNFFPIDGTVEYVAYHPGKYLVAFLPKSSSDNEHNTVVVRKNEREVVLFRQIAGFVARRIICLPKPGDAAVQGEEMGMIRFGSRLDVFLPLDVTVNVRVGDKVRTQKTVLAYF